MYLFILQPWKLVWWSQLFCGSSTARCLFAWLNPPWAFIPWTTARTRIVPPSAARTHSMWPSWRNSWRESTQINLKKPFTGSDVMTCCGWFDGCCRHFFGLWAELHWRSSLLGSFFWRIRAFSSFPQAKWIEEVVPLHKECTVFTLEVLYALQRLAFETSAKNVNWVVFFTEVGD